MEEIENYQVSVYTRIKNNDSFLIFAFREVVASPRNTPPVFHFIQETLIVSAGSGFAGAAVENLRLQKLVWSSRQKNKLSRSRKSCRRLLSVLPPSIPTFSIFNPSPPPPLPSFHRLEPSFGDKASCSPCKNAFPRRETRKLQLGAPIDPVIITFSSLCISLPSPSFSSSVTPDRYGFFRWKLYIYIHYIFWQFNRSFLCRFFF